MGQLQEPARRLNEDFARYIRHGVPLVTLKSAMTLDGKIAPPHAAEALARAPGNPGTEGLLQATGSRAKPLSRARARGLRHQHDAILVGIPAPFSPTIPCSPTVADVPAASKPLLRVITRFASPPATALKLTVDSWCEIQRGQLRRQRRSHGLHFCHRRQEDNRTEIAGRARGNASAHAARRTPRPRRRSAPPR